MPARRASHTALVARKISVQVAEGDDAGALLRGFLDAALGGRRRMTAASFGFAERTAAFDRPARIACIVR